jgi:hypothetical protein
MAELPPDTPRIGVDEWVESVEGRRAGRPSRSVTLFFLQAFVVITTNGSNLSFLGLTGSTNLTGGPNGIPGLDPFDRSTPSAATSTWRWLQRRSS